MRALDLTPSLFPSDGPVSTAGSSTPQPSLRGAPVAAAAGASFPSILTPTVGVAAPAAAPCSGIRVLSLTSRRGVAYAGYVLRGNVPLRPWLARALDQVTTVAFGECP